MVVHALPLGEYCLSCGIGPLLDPCGLCVFCDPTSFNIRVVHEIGVKRERGAA